MGLEKGREAQGEAVEEGLKIGRGFRVKERVEGYLKGFEGLLPRSNHSPKREILRMLSHHQNINLNKQAKLS